MLVQITGWRDFIKEGEQYFSCAQNAVRKQRVIFTPAILYNITAMAIEKFLMGFLMYHGAMADNHTMIDILHSVERITGPQPQLAEEFRYLDSFQEICDLDAFNRRDPNPEEIPRVLACGATVRDFICRTIPLGLTPLPG